VNPSSIRLVDAGRTGQSPLGQRADCNETANDCVWVLVTLGHRLNKRLVTVGGCLHGVVVVPGQHTRFEWADDLWTLADRTHILGGHGTHVARSRLARVPVGRAVLATHGDRLALPVLNVAGPNDGTHWYYESGKKSQIPPSLLIPFEKHLELCFI